MKEEIENAIRESLVLGNQPKGIIEAVEKIMEVFASQDKLVIVEQLDKWIEDCKSQKKLKKLIANMKNDLKKAHELKLETAAFIIKIKISIYEDLINL